jgi:hypothetical protein
MLTYEAIGLAEWIALVAIPARGNPNYSGALYFLVALISAFFSWQRIPGRLTFESVSSWRVPVCSWLAGRLRVETTMVSGSCGVRLLSYPLFCGLDVIEWDPPYGDPLFRPAP